MLAKFGSVPLPFFPVFHNFTFMSMVERNQYFTPEAFGEYLDTHPGRAEYYDGTIVDMAAGSPEQALIAANMIRAIGNAIDGSGCFVYTGDLMVEVESMNSYLLPDLAVICGKSEKSTIVPGSVKNPKLLVEVLSDSTRNRDQGIKWFHYRMLPGLNEFITVEQNKPLVFVHTRNDAGEWVQAAYGSMEDIVGIKSLGIAVSMRAIFAGVEF
jgi:Uma2 family endonuclease